MKITQVLACSLTVGAMIFAVGKASAVPMKLNVSGTFTYQFHDFAPDGSGTATTKTVSFNNNSIIKALNASAVFTTAAGGQIPAGSYFVMDDNHSGIIVTNKFGFSRDLTTLNYFNEGNQQFTSFASFSNNPEVNVYSGKSSAHHQGSKNGLQATVSLFITDGAPSPTTININGLVKNSKSKSAYNVNTGLQNVTSSGSITGVGAGSYLGFPAVVQGKGTASGSGKELYQSQYYQSQ